ncbi:MULTISPECIES: aromatic-ring-hydroxylating dioxygenase subunit beta [Amycolatopsis]|uniref:Anthranilate 1,2-dioxygenase small subunit n=1 Tax=Amycolatopsis echigonensis TaxID=2576905 RepID=A0A2N3WNC7_9PSEU|nr:MULTISPECIES: aromatic-ring-hydroxylating dioxygenase subunit beta [Amycolatopsis]MBB2498320.1 aromatic-ring-hydroxylating dioxygenase subunit beta [Amycolatopsis echigonensis]PKV95362.1 anthranilate 1,2-dioxygenase small subunit [Amycolatopsis niigatensis]
MDAFTLISRAQGSYVRAIDDGPIEDWPEHFAEDAFYKVTTADNHRRGLPAGLIWADNKAMLKDRISALKEANIYEPHVYRHLLGQPAILAESKSGATSETAFLVLRIAGNGPTDVFASGRYLDEYVFADGAALLKKRVVVCDSSRTDTLLVLPL